MSPTRKLSDIAASLTLVSSIFARGSISVPLLTLFQKLRTNASNSSAPSSSVVVYTYFLKPGASRVTVSLPSCTSSNVTIPAFAALISRSLVTTLPKPSLIVTVISLSSQYAPSMLWLKATFTVTSLLTSVTELLIAESSIINSNSAASGSALPA